MAVTYSSKPKKQIYQKCSAISGLNPNQILIFFSTHCNNFISLDFCGTHFEHQ